MTNSIKTATLTFHASHNYGSMLQAYALQQTINSLGCDNVIINLRTLSQKNMYRLPNNFKGLSMKQQILYRILYLRYGKGLALKYRKFEEFIHGELIISDEVETLEQVVEHFSYFDYYIVGSDQIWNTNCRDFDWSYFLPFVKKNKGISYGTSMGPHGRREVGENNYQTIKNYLNNYRAISVRELSTSEIIKEITGQDPTIVLDPTMLLSKEKWMSKISNCKIIKYPYIYLYSVGYSDAYPIAEYLSKKFNLPVVVSDFHARSFVKYSHFTRILDVGPWEFLNLIENSSLVVCGSFHAVVFSTILNIPFFAVNGSKDDRMSNVLKITHLEHRSISFDDFVEKSNETFDIDFSPIEESIEIERKKSIMFLRNALKAE